MKNLSLQLGRNSPPLTLISEAKPIGARNDSVDRFKLGPPPGITGVVGAQRD